MMELQKINLAVRSPISTPLRGDTIWGHVCWAIVLHHGESGLQKFFNRYDEGEVPLALSDAFPKDTLPFPLLRPTIPEQIDSPDELDHWKKMQKLEMVPKSFYYSATSFSYKKLYAALEKDDFITISQHWEKNTKKHNTINRLTGTTGEEGSFFTSSELWPRQSSFDLYAHSTFNNDELHELIVWSFQSGYGADSSTGKGAIEVLSVDTCTFPDHGNRKIALAPFIPETFSNYPNLRTKNSTKFGKLGNFYSGSKNPFKKPTLLFQAGSSWDAHNASPVCGTLIKHIHGDPKIRQCALAPILYFQEEGGQNEHE